MPINRIKHKIIVTLTDFFKNSQLLIKKYTIKSIKLAATSSTGNLLFLKEPIAYTPKRQVSPKPLRFLY